MIMLSEIDIWDFVMSHPVIFLALSILVVGIVLLIGLKKNFGPRLSGFWRSVRRKDEPAPSTESAQSGHNLRNNETKQKNINKIDIRIVPQSSEPTYGAGNVKQYGSDKLKEEVPAKPSAISSPESADEFEFYKCGLCADKKVWTTIKENPFISISNFTDYVDLVEHISHTANTFLLWTMNTSPIEVLEKTDNVKQGVDKKTGFTDYDVAFSKFEVKKKIRLVIFPNLDFANAYVIENDSIRKEKFESIHNRKNTFLLFTIKDLLLKHFGCSDKNTILRDIGYVLAENDHRGGLIFYSDFRTDESEDMGDYHTHRKTIFTPSSFHGNNKHDYYDDNFRDNLDFHKALSEDLCKYKSEKKHPYAFNTVAGAMKAYASTFNTRSKKTR